jgi:tetratricopeptide (TPR) repeat protein
LDRAIDIKRRAQRFIQSGDLDGALAEYERLVAADDADPYNYVLLADLLYKKGDHENAAKRYLTAASCYEKAGLYKNAIAVGKKMLRLALSPAAVLDRLANLHALDGLATEATLYYTQFADQMVREGKTREATTALRKAFDCCNENIKALERLAEVLSLADDAPASAKALAEAAHYYRRSGQTADADRCAARAEQMQPGAGAAFEAQAPLPPPPGAKPAGPSPAGLHRSAPEPGVRTASFEAPRLHVPPPAARDSAVTAEPPGLETDGPPRFVPPTENRMPALELDHHSSAPVAPAPVIPTPSASMNGEPADPELPADLEGVERLLGLAQTEFRAGNRENAAGILARAAQAYESLGRFDNAASIYRSLCRGPHATDAMIELWLRNCEQRDDRREAAQVACELGDRAIQSDDLEEARTWFERATQFDQNNLVAQRRLERLASAAVPAPAPVPEAPAPVAEAPAPVTPAAPEQPEGKVEVAVDRGQAVTFDFASMLAEFQRGVETQLSGDAQAHYDLAMAYREMGLTQQAIESFRLASKDVNFKQRAAEMIGHCLLAEGRFEEASHELSEALGDAGLDADSAVGIRFQLGLSLEAAGRSHEALIEFERVFEIQASYPDVAQKIRDLRKSLEAA